MKRSRFLANLHWTDILSWLLLAILVVRAGFFLVYSVRTILFPFPVDYDEGVALHSALLLVRGEAVYRPLQAGEFVSSQYTPLYYLLMAPALWLIGPSLVPGRLIAFLATLGSGALLAGLALQLGASRRGAFTAALMPLAVGTTFIWSTLAKPDTLALFLSLLVLYWVVRFGESRWVYLVTVWFALGFFVKQNAIVVAGPALFYYFLRRPRRGLVIGSLALLLAAGPFFLLNALTDGALYLHTLGFHTLPWELTHLWSTLEPLVVFTPGLMLLTLFAAWHQARNRAWPALVLLAGGCLFLLTGGRMGTSWSFQLPLIFAMALSSSLLLFPRPAQTKPYIIKGFPARWRALLLILAVLQFALIPNPLRWYRTDLLASPEREQELAAVCEIVRQAPAPILSEDVGLLLLCGKEPRYNDPFMMAQLSRADRWDETELVRQIEEEQFSLVILAYDIASFPVEKTEVLRWTTATLAALRKHYALWQEAGQVFVYRPQGIAPLLGADVGHLWGGVCWAPAGTKDPGDNGIHPAKELEARP